MAETGIAIGIEVIKAVAKHCLDLCKAAQQYREDAARIHLRLAFVLSRVPEWSNQITARIDDPGCASLVQNLHTALTNLTACVEALGSIDEKNWRHKIKLFFNGKNLHTELLRAEANLNRTLLDLNHDNTSFIAQHIASLHENFVSLQGTEDEKLSNILKDFDNIPSGNYSNPKETLKDVIDVELEECYEEKENDDDDPNGKVRAVPKTIDTETTVESFEDDLSLLITNRSSITFSETCLGTGGFAKVYKGTFEGYDVAIKVIDVYRNYDNKEDMPEKVYRAEIERVRDEAIILKECSVHSNIVDVYGYSHTQQKGSNPFIIMELLHWSLFTLIHDDKDVDFSFRTRLKLLRDVASALEFLHLQRYVHQDVKSSNILVDQQCTTAKLTDFGVTERKGFDTTQTRRHNTVLTTVIESSGKKAPGTRTYQAPELILGRTTEASREAEMYSFGVTCWECMSRRIPHNKNEDNIVNLARHSTKLMLQFPLRSYLIDKGASLSFDEQVVFTVLEKVTYLCLSKFRPLRPNATQVLQYLDNHRSFNPDILLVAPLSKWHNEPIIDNLTSDNNEPIVPIAEPNGTNLDDEIIIGRSLTSANQSGAVENPDVSNIQNVSINDVVELQINNQPSGTTLASADIGSDNERGDRNNEEIGQKQDEIMDSTHKKGTLIHLVQQNWKLGLCIAQTVIIGIAVAVVVLLMLQPSPDEPTQVTASRTCFVTPSELRSSVIDYINGDPSVRTKYGTKIGDWCVDNIEDFSWLFGDKTEPYTFYDTFNEDISKWNTSSAKSMSCMFSDADAFNRNISSWDVSKVTDMSYMFWSADGFNGDLSSWDVSKVTDMSYMFSGADAFNGDLSSWDVSKVRDMSHMFSSTDTFNCDLSSWDVSNVTVMSEMFWYANAFNGNISSWDVSKVTDMSYMFTSADVFNGDLSSWDVSKVTDMSNMFVDADTFNSNLSSWDVSKVTDMSNMFTNADTFQQNLCTWGNRLNNNTNVTEMFSGTVCTTTSDPLFNNSSPGPFCFLCKN